MLFHIHNGLNIVRGAAPAGTGCRTVRGDGSVMKLNASPAPLLPPGAEDPASPLPTQRGDPDPVVGLDPPSPAAEVGSQLLTGPGSDPRRVGAHGRGQAAAPPAGPWPGPGFH